MSNDLRCFSGNKEEEKYQAIVRYLKKGGKLSRGPSYFTTKSGHDYRTSSGQVLSQKALTSLRRAGVLQTSWENRRSYIQWDHQFISQEDVLLRLSAGEEFLYVPTADCYQAKDGKLVTVALINFLTSKQRARVIDGVVSRDTPELQQARKLELWLHNRQMTQTIVLRMVQCINAAKTDDAKFEQVCKLVYSCIKGPHSKRIRQQFKRLKSSGIDLIHPAL